MVPFTLTSKSVVALALAFAVSVALFFALSAGQSYAQQGQSSACTENIAHNSTIHGEWSFHCEASFNSTDDSRTRYARYYAFSLSSETDVSISLSSEEDTQMYLYDNPYVSGGTFHENDDIDADNTNSQLDLTLEGGDYLIEATTYRSGVEGEFTLIVDIGVEPPPPSTPDNSHCFRNIPYYTDIEWSWSSSCVSGWKSPHDNKDRYSRYFFFTLEEESTVTIDLSSDYDTYLYLRAGRGAYGRALHKNDDISASDSDSQISATLPQGNYTIEATTYFSETEGDFELTVSGIKDAPANPDPLPTPEPDPTAEPDPLYAEDCGTTLAGKTITVTGTWTSDCASASRTHSNAHFYPFELTGHSVITVSLVSTDADPYLYLLDESGDILGNGALGIKMRLNAGDYVIEAATYRPSRTGDFTLTVTIESETEKADPKCATDDVVPDWDGANSGLYHDCLVLTSMYFGYDYDLDDGVIDVPGFTNGDTSLNWTNTIPLCGSGGWRDGWDGIECAGDPLRVTKVDLGMHYFLGLWWKDHDGDGEYDEGELIFRNDEFDYRLRGGLALIDPGKEAGLSEVTEFNVSQNELSGSVPSALASVMPNLTSLDLGGNQFTGSIPTALGDLEYLEYLDLSWNQLTGSIPTELGDLSNLTRLFLNDNELDGSIPSSLTGLENLQVLELRVNRLTGSIPTGFGGMEELWSLDLTGNKLTGSIPSDIGDEDSPLLYLYLGANRLTGSIPASLGSLGRLEILDLSHNELGGEIPDALTDLVRSPNDGKYGRLDMLGLYGDDVQFTGCIPDLLFNIRLNDLVHLGLYHGIRGCSDPRRAADPPPSPTPKLTPTPEPIGYECEDPDIGLIENPADHPGLVADCKVLFGMVEEIYKRDQGVYRNFGWQGTGIANWSGITVSGSPKRVTAIDLSGQRQVGTFTLPSGLVAAGGLSELTSLDVSYNSFEGSIPSSIASLTNLTNLDLSGNQFSGSFPSGVTNLTGLTNLGLSSNGLTGSIPSSISNLTNITTLDLSYNSLSGSIPTSIGSMSNLGTLDLSNNSLSGSIPTELGNISGLTKLDLHSNKLTGSIPSSLGDNLSSLTHLVLSDNNLSGAIPASLGGLNNLIELWVYGENQAFTGCIPHQLESRFPYIAVPGADGVDLQFCEPPPPPPPPPLVVPSGSCYKNLHDYRITDNEFEVTSGEWSESCKSPRKDANGDDRFAKYYVFRVTENTRVDLSAGVNTQQYDGGDVHILSGSGNNGKVLATTNDIWNNSSNCKVLEPGNYTIEITFNRSWLAKDPEGVGLGDSHSLYVSFYEGEACRQSVPSVPVPSDAPGVTGVSVVSDAGTDDTYGLGDRVEVRVTFDEPVDVTGTPRIKIDMSSAGWGEKWAAYASGGGTSSLAFVHTVVEPNISKQGIAVLANTLELNGGTIRSGGNDANLAHVGLGHDAEHKVDWRE